MSGQISRKMINDETMAKIGNLFHGRKEKRRAIELQKQTEAIELEVNEIFREFEMGPKVEDYYKEIARNDDDFRKKCLRNVTDLYEDEVIHVIERDKNMINEFCGSQGSGKSRSGIGIIVHYEGTRLKLTNQRPNHHFCFSSAQLQAIFPNIPDADYIQSDEWPRLTGANAKVILDKLANLIDQLRATHKCVNICTPEMTIIGGINNIFVPFGHCREYFKTKNPRDMVSRVLWFHVDETGKAMKVSLRGVVYIDISLTTEIWEEYTTVKMENIKKLQENRGGAGVSTEHFKFLDEIADALFEFAAKDGYPADPENPAKSVLDMYILEAGIEGLSKRDESIVKNLVVKKAKLAHAEKCKAAAPKPSIEWANGKFQITEAIEDHLLEEIRKESKSPKIDRNIAIYKKVTREVGVTYATIVNDPILGADFKSIQNVDEIMKTFEKEIKGNLGESQGKLNVKKGKLWEDYLHPELLKKFAKVIHDGGIGRPDFICETNDKKMVIISAKCLKLTQDTSIPYDESSAEIDYARKIYPKEGQIPEIQMYLMNSFNWHFYKRDFPPEVVTDEKYDLKGHNHRIHLDKFDD